MFEMLSYIYRGVFLRNHNKQRPLPPLLGQCLLDYCFPQASWVEVQHWKGDGRGWGQPRRGTVGNCFELFLIRKSLKHGNLCHFSQSVSTNFVANCGVANKPIWFFCVKLDFLLSCGKYWNFNNILYLYCVLIVPGSLLLRGEVRGRPPVIKQISWFQVPVWY